MVFIKEGKEVLIESASKIVHLPPHVNPAITLIINIL